ncbi:MAG: CoA pyrophosphatase [Paracoccus sp. (in: a-proteobacteria)]|uniref:NUDIX hydrolase n=1 Tax=Paracoccus sp. TaxID=267 RepID=UPI0026E00612|nr:CoA pyrophosphatase [Paracoccus sp. (in: a-proteobacteria)]MDO5621790.1 CoA pyrophosphatase [Paracoccus sp. (in: a-proteobacteria)]
MNGLRDKLLAALNQPSGDSSDFDLNPGVTPPGTPLRDAGVLAAFYPDGQLILTKRSSALRHHPGQIALPGGKVEPSDGGVIGAALREAHEEIGLPRDGVEILGTLPAHRTVTSFRMVPVLALVTAPFTPMPEQGEVDEIFTLPFAHIADPARYRIERRMWGGQWRAYRAAPFGPYYLWGATARVLYGLAERLNR